jgi:uncharacterized membrane protein
MIAGMELEEGGADAGPAEARTRQARREKRRLEAFSDGVFAIAVTLLVLEIKVPALSDPASGGLGLALLRQWPSYFAYLLSFSVILIMWVNHHVLLDLVREVDHAFLYLNGLLLMVITLLPFPTALLAQYGEDPKNGHVAAAVYCGLCVLIALFFNAVWWYAAARARLLHDGVMTGGAVTRRYMFGPLLYLVALAVAFVSVAGALLICAGLAVFFAWPYRPPAAAS